jgi:potassium-dependent mechanosensitive channel
MRLFDALKEAGIEIPFPQQDVHVRSVDVAAREAIAATLMQRPVPEPGHPPG